jgi:hypothetical protein
MDNDMTFPATSRPSTDLDPLDDELDDPFEGAFAVRRSRRRRIVQVLGGLLIAGTVSSAVWMINRTPGARNEALSWLTLGHPQQADRVIRAAEGKIHELLKK